MASYIERRRFLATLGGAAVAWPLAARAQQPALPVIGFIDAAFAAERTEFMAAFRQASLTPVTSKGQNVAIEYRWAEGRYDRLPELAAELVGRRVDVIVATGGSGAAAKAATAAIPIVALSGGDPVEEGLVASLNRPGGNVTGVALFASSLGPKRFELLRELVPTAKLIAVMANPTNPPGNADRRDVEAAARAIGQRIIVLEASGESDFEPAFTAMVRQRADALLVMADPFFNSRRKQLVALVAQHAVPAVYERREFAEAGGLMSYGSSITEAQRQIGLYTGQILKGTKPAELPAVKIELVINLKTAKTLGLTFPITLLARADEVIE
jgi:putative tryptophan/tyrosine transport system substrate-binding protein